MRMVPGILVTPASLDVAPPELALELAPLLLDEEPLDEEPLDELLELL